MAEAACAVAEWWPPSLLRGGRRGRRQRFLGADAEHAPRRRSHDPVDRQPVASLQPSDRRLGFGTEHAVGREVERRLESLHRCHSPGSPVRSLPGVAVDAARRGGRSRWRRSLAAAQRTERFRPDDPVHAEPVRRLEAFDRGFGFRAVDAVDRDAERAAGEVRPGGLLAGVSDDDEFGRGRRFAAACGASTLAPPLARLAVGPTVNAASAPSDMRLARVPPGTNWSCAARLRARERPSESSQGCSSARSRPTSYAAARRAGRGSRGCRS